MRATTCFICGWRQSSGLSGVLDANESHCIYLFYLFRCSLEQYFMLSLFLLYYAICDQYQQMELKFLTMNDEGKQSILLAG